MPEVLYLTDQSDHIYAGGSKLTQSDLTITQVNMLVVGYLKSNRSELSFLPSLKFAYVQISLHDTGEQTMQIVWCLQQRACQNNHGMYKG